jgi:hypothetical protein
MARHPVLDPSGLARVASRLGSLIPGFAAYSEPTRLQEDDRALRKAVADQIGMVLGRLQRGLSRMEDRLSDLEVADAEHLAALLARHRDRIHFAPAGGAARLEQHRLEDLETAGLLSLDAGLWATLEELDDLIGSWELETRKGSGDWPGSALTDVVAELEAVLDERESFLRS